jgi:LacI family transcriptional regulator
MRRHAQTPSLGQIATAAGVSRAAVSMALRNHPRIPALTRQRIQKIATELGWKPNPLLAEAMSAIRAAQPPADRVTLAWLTAHSTRLGWRQEPFFRRCHDGAEARATAAGYRLEHFWLGDAGGSASRLGDILLARGIPAVIIAPLPDPMPLNLPWDQLTAATVAYSLTSPRLHRAADNHCASARVAVAHLRAGGRRRIGLALSSNYDRRVQGLWSAGYLWQTHDEGIADPDLLHRPAELDAPAFLTWLDRARPDAVISTDPRVLAWLRESGRRVPADVAYASLDLPADDGAVAGIYQDAAHIGATVVDVLAGQLLRHERGLPEKPRSVIVDARWVDGATAPAAPQRETQIGEAPHQGHGSYPAIPVPFD